MMSPENAVVAVETVTAIIDGLEVHGLHEVMRIWPRIRGSD